MNVSAYNHGSMGYHTAAGWLQSFVEFPPRMKPGSFSLDRVMEQVQSQPGKN